MSTHDFDNSDGRNNNVSLNDIAEFLISRDEIKADEFEQLKGYLNALLKKDGKKLPAFPYLESAREFVDIAEKEGYQHLDSLSIEVLCNFIECASYEINDEEPVSDNINSENLTNYTETANDIDMSPEFEPDSEIIESNSAPETKATSIPESPE